ncbi:hypothetical protein EDC94DRAFT_624628, partial [Helicostylum pulchrum]
MLSVGLLGFCLTGFFIPKRSLGLKSILVCHLHLSVYVGFFLSNHIYYVVDSRWLYSNDVGTGIKSLFFSVIICFLIM